MFILCSTGKVEGFGVRKMAKFRIPDLSLNMNSYTGPSGQRYLFYKDHFGGTEVKNKEDIDYFRKENAFMEEGKETKYYKAREVIPEPETIDDIVEPKEKYTKTRLINMYKSEQVKILKKLGAEEIPSREAQRVELILKLQGA